MRQLAVTPRMARILRVFLEDPGQPRYGFELMRSTGLASGSLYPMLAKLEEAGWLAGIREEIDPKAAGRPPRVNYVITAGGASAARAQLTALSELYRPPAPRDRTAHRGTGRAPGHPRAQ
jgi:PadR family transcriptional regulator PadR